MAEILNRLYVKVYLTIVGSLFLVVIVSALVWRAGPEREAAHDASEMAGAVAAAALGDPAAPVADQQEAIAKLASLMKADLAVYARDDRLLGSSGASLPAPSELNNNRRLAHFHGPIWSLRLADGRLIIVRPPFKMQRHAVGFFWHLTIVALLLAVGSFPVVRSLTRRLEKLQKGVEALGAGDLSARVEVRGSDEIARVAESFNKAAARIEDLVGAHKMLLANASHELRTPLTRLRMGVELLKEKADPKRKAELEQDIAELDQLIGEILLASRLDASKELEAVEDVDLLALAAEEAARFDGISVAGVPLTARGDSRLLRRLLRNLLENAQRYGKPPVEVEVSATGGKQRLAVFDHGPGVPEGERIFEPFHRTASAGSPGTGLGLALVRQIARRHGGDVAVVKEGARSGFVVTLPGPVPAAQVRPPSP